MPEIELNNFNDITVGTELFKSLDITQSELISPIQTAKIRDIAGFLNEHPDPLFIVGSIIRSNKNPNINNLDHLWSYVKLNNNKAELTVKLEKINKELQYYGQ